MLLPQGLRSGKWAWPALPPIFLLKYLDSYQPVFLFTYLDSYQPIFLLKYLDSNQQLPKFPRTGNRSEGQLRKTELKLYEVVMGTVFRSLFYGIVRPKALLSFGSSLFFPRRASIANHQLLVYENGLSQF